MADATGLTPPILDPSQYPAYLDAQRKQQLAQMLMGAFQQSNQTPSDWNQMKVVPRRGALQNVSTLASALMAGKAIGDSQQAQQQYFQGLYGVGGQQPSPASGAPTGPGAGIVSPDASPSAQDAAQAVTNMPAGAGLTAPQPAAVAPQPSRNPMIPPGMTPGSAQAMLNMMGPEMYAKTFLAPQFQTPEIVAKLRSAGISPTSPQGLAIQRGALTKETAIESRPGGTIIDPVSGRTMVGADPSKGEYYGVGPDGTVTAFPIENDATIQAWRQGLSTAATQANTPRDIPMGGGVTRLGYPDTPPALRGTSSAPNAALPGAGPGQLPPQSNGAPSPQAPRPAPPPPAAPTWDGAWNNVPKLKIPTTPGQTSNTFQSGQLTNAVKKDSELVDAYGTEARDADRRLQYNAQALQALPNAEVGPMSEWLTSNRSRLIQMGVPANLIPDSGSVTPTLELNKNLKNAALQNARQNFPRLTQMETQLQTEELSPSPTMTRDAISALVRQDNMQAQYAKQRAADYQRFRNGGGDPTQFENWYAQNRPLSRFAAQSDTPPAALARVHANPGVLPAFKSKYGWDPTQ